MHGIPGEARMWLKHLVAIGMFVLFTSTIALLPMRPAHAFPLPTDPVFMLTGDSVSASVLDALQTRALDKWGWRVVDASLPACSLMGERLAWPDGTPKTTGTRCDRVTTIQDDMLAGESPGVVIWWDRLSQMPYMTRTDPSSFVLSGTDRFWTLRHADLKERAQHFIDAGAQIVFVATEPMGIGVYDRCPTWTVTRLCAEWVRFRMVHYDDVTRRWNRMLRNYARNHPDTTMYITVTPQICRTNVSPCDDRIDGVPARLDGTHYDGAGATKLARVMLNEIKLALFPRA